MLTELIGALLSMAAAFVSLLGVVSGTYGFMYRDPLEVVVGGGLLIGGLSILGYALEAL